MPKIITRSGVPLPSTKKVVKGPVSPARLDEIKQYIADIKKIIADSTPSQYSGKISIDESIKFGFVDSFLMKKQKPDQNGFYSNTRLISNSFTDLKDAISYMAANNLYNSKSLIMYKSVSNKWNFQLLKILPNLKNKESVDKYLLLL